MKRVKQLQHECLENRTVLSAVPLGGAAELAPNALGEVQRYIVVGDPNGVPPDSPAAHVDPNTPFSPFAGVGSLLIDRPGPGAALCSGVAISPSYVLTAGHCMDFVGDDGVADVDPSEVTFHVNIGPRSIKRDVSELTVHPSFDGVKVNDDLTVLKLKQPLPAVVPSYPLKETPFIYIERTIQVGYGTTGDGVNGYILNSTSLDTKRVGLNQAEVYLLDDEGSGTREVFLTDFDGPDASTNLFGPSIPLFLTLGNHLETTVGPGDSGGASFVLDADGQLVLFGLNTFGFEAKQPAPLFGSGAGGPILSPYVEWIESITGDEKINRRGMAVGHEQLEPGDAADLVPDSASFLAATAVDQAMSDNRLDETDPKAMSTVRVDSASTQTSTAAKAQQQTLAAWGQGSLFTGSCLRFEDVLTENEGSEAPELSLSSSPYVWWDFP
jgi:secreted trypsin-like serine protease